MVDLTDMPGEWVFSSPEIKGGEIIITLDQLKAVLFGNVSDIPGCIIKMNNNPFGRVKVGDCQYVFWRPKAANSEFR